jgi:hypothetical protein
MDVDELLDALDSFDDIPTVKKGINHSTQKTQDVDDLLNSFNSIQNYSKIVQLPNKSKNLSNESLDIDKLLIELDPTKQSTSTIYSMTPQTSITSSSNVVSQRKGSLVNRKCPIVFFGPGECNNIRCIKCDFKCLVFENREWKNVDYLFFRNFMPKVVDLEKRLGDSKNSTSICCQCSWITVKKRTSVKDTELKWICGGH